MLGRWTQQVELLIAGGGLIGLLLGSACAGAGPGRRRSPIAKIPGQCSGRPSTGAARRSPTAPAAFSMPSPCGRRSPARPSRSSKSGLADDGSPLFLHYDRRDLQDPTPLGYIVENRVLRRVLLERIRSPESLSFLAPLEVEAVETSSLAAVATLSDGRQIVLA